MAGQYHVGLDIGTATIKAVVVEERGRALAPRLFLREQSAGVRKGAVEDPAELALQLERVFAQIRAFSKNALKSTIVVLGTYQLKAQVSRGIIAVSRAGGEISSEDAERAKKASEAIQVGPNRTVVHNITREFIVDGVSDISDPVGLSGSRLEVSTLVVDAFEPHVRNLLRVIEVAGGRLTGVYAAPLAAAAATLSKSQREVGTAVLDLGAGTTGLAVFEEHKLLNISKFPVGAGNITRDLAIGLKIPVQAAETVKVRTGSAIAREVSAREHINISEFCPGLPGSVSRRAVSEIIEQRLAEIFEMADAELKAVGKSGQLAGGVVLIGGGAKLPGATDLARRELGLSAQVGSPLAEGWEIDADGIGSMFEDPEYICALGAVLCGLERDGLRAPSNNSGRGISGGRLHQAWNWLVRSVAP